MSQPKPLQNPSASQSPGTEHAWGPEGPGWERHTDDGFLGLIGPIWGLKPDKGIGRFCFRAAPKHCNRMGLLHGGMLMAFADKALGTTARWDDINRRHVTIQLDVQFVEPVEIGEIVEMDCQILKRARTLVYVDGVMRVGSRKVAGTHGIWKILQPKR